MMKVLSSVAAFALAGLLVGSSAAEDPAETAAQLTAEQSAGIMKNFVASKFAGKWTFSKMMVRVEKTGEDIDLSPGAEP